MRQQVGGHERTVGMATNGDVIAIGHATAHHFIHGCLRVGHQLFDVGVVRLLVALADDRHRRAGQHHIPLGQERLRAPVADRIEAVRRIGHLAGRSRTLELARVGPHQQRPRAVALRVVARRQQQGRGQVDAILALVADLLLLHALQLRQRMREVSQRTRCSTGIGQRLHVEVGRLIRALAAQQQRAGLVVQQRHRQRIARRLRVEQAGGLARGNVEAVHERTIAFRRCTGTGQIQAAAIGAGLQQRAPAVVAGQQRPARIGIAVLPVAIPQQARLGSGIVRGDQPGPGLARLPPRLGQQGQVATAPVDAHQTAAELGQRDRRLVERRSLHQHRIAHLGLPVRVAAVLGFGPDQRGIGITTPADIAHAGHFSVVAGRQTFHQRTHGHGVHQLAAGTVDHFNAARETAHRHHVGIRPLHRLAQHEAAIRRHRKAHEDASCADRAGVAIQADFHRLGGGVVIELARVGLVLQQVLVGTDRHHAAALAGLLHGRAGRNAVGGRGRTKVGRTGEHHQAAAVRQPLVATADHRVQAGDQTTGAAAGHIHQPQFIGAAGGVDLVEGQPLLVRRPHHAGDRQRGRQAADLPFLAVGHVHQPQLLAEAEAAVGEGARVDAQAGQLQFRLRHHLDRRQRRHLHHRGDIAAWRQVQRGRARRVHHRLQRRRRQFVAVDALGLYLGGLRGRGPGQRSHRQQSHRQDQAGPAPCAARVHAHRSTCVMRENTDLNRPCT